MQLKISNLISLVVLMDTKSNWILGFSLLLRLLLIFNKFVFAFFVASPVILCDIVGAWLDEFKYLNVYLQFVIDNYFLLGVNM